MQPATFGSMQGKRISPDDRGAWEPGDYWRQADGAWRGCTPNGLLVTLDQHNVTEFEDGTISVTPKIEIHGRAHWHGYVHRGFWSAV